MLLSTCVTVPNLVILVQAILAPGKLPLRAQRQEKLPLGKLQAKTFGL